MVLDAEEVSSVPVREFHYKMTQATAELIALVERMASGQIVRLPVNRMLSVAQRRAEAKATRDRLRTVEKHVGKIFTVQQRGYDLYLLRDREEVLYEEQENSVRTVGSIRKTKW